MFSFKILYQLGGVTVQAETIQCCLLLSTKQETPTGVQMLALMPTISKATMSQTCLLAGIIRWTIPKHISTFQKTRMLSMLVMEVEMAIASPSALRFVLILMVIFKVQLTEPHGWSRISALGATYLSQIFANISIGVVRIARKISVQGGRLVGMFFLIKYGQT